MAASKNDCSATCTAPPMWKVRMVSWVPGSPIDWAAMTPDRLADVHRRAARQVAAVAGAADADLGLAGEHRADLGRLDAVLLEQVDHVLVEIGVGGDDDLDRCPAP